MIGRPHESEAASYYFNYINLVPGDDAQSVMDGQLDEVESFLSTIPQPKSLYRYAPDKWSICEVVNHVTDAERVFALRALWFARGFDSPLPSFEQDIASRAAEADRVTWNDHLDEFRNVRLATLSFFRNLSPNAWMRTGVASDNRFTVRALAYIIAGHTAHHMKILRERYLQ